MRIVISSAALALALAAVGCDRAPVGAPQHGQESASMGLLNGGGKTVVAQYSADAGYGMPNPQPGSPITPKYEAGVAPLPPPSTPAPTPLPSAPAPSTPSPGTPAPTTPPPSPTIPPSIP